MTTAPPAPDRSPPRSLVHPDGWPFILGLLALAAAFGYVWKPLAGMFAALALWALWFFRNPGRKAPAEKGAIVSPADGVVCAIEEAAWPKETGLGGPRRTRISIFMNVLNVHVNRVPASGTVSALHYIPGKFFNASLDKASEHNERNAVRLRLADGRELAVVQIAGLIARRIKCYIGENLPVRAGQRFGMIRFGSRVDVYLPPGVNALVAEGQRAIGGETVLADLLSGETPRHGEVR